jgi:hypothetical protein
VANLQKTVKARIFQGNPAFAAVFQLDKFTLAP